MTIAPSSLKNACIPCHQAPSSGCRLLYSFIVLLVLQATKTFYNQEYKENNLALTYKEEEAPPDTMGPPAEKEKEPPPLTEEPQPPELIAESQPELQPAPTTTADLLVLLSSLMPYIL